MRITTLGGDVPFRLFTFPDGQRHFQLLTDFVSSAGGPINVSIESRIASSDELFDILLAKDVLDSVGAAVTLNIRYLLAARMDRRIKWDQPFTLQIVARILTGSGFRRIRVLDPHSSVTTSLLEAVAVLPRNIVDRIFERYVPDETVVIAPDVGATDRVRWLVGDRFHVMQGRKHRNVQTGSLSGFSVDDLPSVKGKVCLILDDICDGGGTFTGLSNVLHNAGASNVDLYVTHGIFSQGTPLAGIRTIYTTDSFREAGPSLAADGTVTFPIIMSDLK